MARIAFLIFFCVHRGVAAAEAAAKSKMETSVGAAASGGDSGSALSTGAAYIFGRDGVPPTFALDHEAVLEGVVTVGEFFGPPGFGEDPARDSVERQLYLQTPVAVRYAAGKPAGGAARCAEAGPLIQLAPISPGAYARARALQGRRVRARGILFAAQTGHHHTPVLIELRDASAVVPVKSYGGWRGQ